MSKRNNAQLPEFSEISFAPGVAFARKAIWWWLPLLYLLISDAFYLRTYDSAQVKISLLQMGGFALVGLWVSLLALEGRKAFRKEDFVFLAPFFAYLVYVLISFCHAPYKGSSVDDLVRYVLYMSVSLIVIREFNESAINRLTKVLLVTAYIAILYGFIQFLDSRCFPPKDVGPGLDPFIWRQAFGTRIFSTYGNPNFFGNFLVLILPIVVTQYLKNRSVYLLPLIALDLLCLYGTDTKGAWMGFGISSCVFAAIYIYFFTQIDRKKLIKVFLALAVVAAVAVAGVLDYALKSPTSVPFRVATWLSTWEMMETHPLIGVGVGSFKVIYPTYRRPIIFHLEGKHNTETDHAEEEHLEQWMDNGLIGFGIYLWLIFFVTTVGLRGLNSMTETLKGNRPPPAAYDLLGYLTALLGMLFHNFTDVSMRFVSSGIFLGLLPGVIINLSRGQALWELHYKDERSETAEPAQSGPGFNIYSLWALRAAAAAGVLYAAFLLIREFSGLQGPLSGYGAGGEILQWWISWLTMLAIITGLSYAFIKINLKGLSRAVPLISLVMLIPIYYFWGWFKGDVYHNMAIFFSKQGKWEEAISYYKRVNRLNQYFIMPYYFVGNVFNDRFNMERQYRKEWGDENNIPRTDYDRAMAAYEKARAIAPNYVQMHHQVGTLYMKMHDYYLNQGRTAEADRFLDKALARLDLYENLDPVYAPNHYRKAQIYIAKKDYPSAEREYLNNINAWKCDRPGHLHETPEAYTYLGNLESAMGKYKEAFEAYGHALALSPEAQPAKSQYAALKQKFGFIAPAQPEKAALK
ncbi:MAG: O-antigen ligase family protein [Elusimicrobiales bacterium]|jgi:O-antigen ligase